MTFSLSLFPLDRPHYLRGSFLIGYVTSLGKGCTSFYGMCCMGSLKLPSLMAMPGAQVQGLRAK
jgi:uncharacterized membrane protein YedE/YeeE